MLAQLLDLLRGRLLALEECLAHAHCPEGHRFRLLQPPVCDSHQLHASAAQVDAEPVGERKRVGDREVAVAGLLRPIDHAHLETRALADRGQQLIAVQGVADRAGGHGVHLFDARGAKERREHRGGANGAVYRLRLKHAALAHHPHLRASPRGSRRRGSTSSPAHTEDHEPERVRSPCR